MAFATAAAAGVDEQGRAALSGGRELENGGFLAYVDGIMTSPIFDTPLRLVRANPREATVAFAALAFSAAAMASVVAHAPAHDPLAKPAPVAVVAPPPPPENAVQLIAPDQALAINRESPVTAPAGPAAAPFVLGPASAAARSAATDCLAQAIYYEAGNESDDGQRAVAQVVLNRVRHPAFPASVCGVVYQGSTRPTGCQFTFTCDGSLAHRPGTEAWDRARRVAGEALAGSIFAGVGNATHYHANYVLPVWAATLAKTDVVGAHLFYRWQGGWGQPGAFVQHYSGHEAGAELLRGAALRAHEAYLAAGTPTAGHGGVTGAVATARAEGLPVTQAPGGGVRLHFTPQARAAVEAAVTTKRLEPEMGPKLKALLDAGAPAEDQKPLGTS